MQYIDTKKKRPLSPHIGIYRPQISSVLSILHRISGVVNFITILALVWWVVSITYADHPPQEGAVWAFFSTGFGTFVLVGLSYSLFFHFCTGIRHLFWDLGYGFKVTTVTLTGWLAIVVSLVLTMITWFIILSLM